MAFDLSVRMSLCPREDYHRVEQHFTEVGLPTRAAFIDPPLTVKADDLLEIMRRDKKALGGKMRFIVLSGIGHAFINDDVPEDIVRTVLTDSLGVPVTKDRKTAFSSL
jgi:3-dehydroquinate synthase